MPGERWGGDGGNGRADEDKELEAAEEGREEEIFDYM